MGATHLMGPHESNSNNKHRFLKRHNANLRYAAVFCKVMLNNMNISARSPVKGKVVPPRLSLRTTDITVCNKQK